MTDGVSVVQELSKISFASVLNNDFRFQVDGSLHNMDQIINTDSH